MDNSISLEGPPIQGAVRSGGGSAGTPAPMDTGNAGMPLDSAFQGLQDIRSLEEEIARVEKALRDIPPVPSNTGVEHMEGDDSDDDDKIMASARRHVQQPVRRKKTMSIRDLESPYYGYAPVSNPSVDAYIDTGRRLKDGAPFMSVRSPALGLHDPIYIQDVVWPCAIAAIAVLVSFVYLLARSSSLAKKLASTQVELERIRQLRMSAWPPSIYEFERAHQVPV
jgi:hypothetical protein